MTQESLHPFLKTLHPLQLILILMNHNFTTGQQAQVRILYIYIYIDCLTRREEEELNWKAREDGASERKKKRDAQRRQLWDGEGREGGDGYINNEAGEILIPMDLVRSACGFGMGWTRA
jgi:hypothetical protein